MLFNSLAFLLFFPTVCILFYCIPARQIKYRNLLLLLASYYFYMNWKPVYALLLLTSTVLTYLASIAIERSKEQRRRKLCLTAGIVLNLSILVLFKYFNFLALNLRDILGLAGLTISVPSFDALLPVGISFYTFQALGYSIDVYRGKTVAERNFLTYALFVSFFPQLVAGPIERSSNLLPQFKSKHFFDDVRVMQGLRWMLWGYFLKLVLADRCGLYVDTIFNHVDKHNGGSFLLASFLFSFQIYGDFAGYSLIAIGAAKVLGFQLMENFRHPYFSCTVGEFWHRWHISLSTWFKDYVYIPLGGNRVGRMRHYFNLLVTFVLSGIWHGANWTFLCWGTLHGLALCLEKAFGFHGKHQSPARLLYWVVTFVFLCITWMVFRADSLSDVITIATSMVTDMGIPYVQDVGYGVIASALMAIIIVLVKELSEEFDWAIRRMLGRIPLAQYVYMASLIAFISLFGIFGNNQFIYFQF